MALLGLLAPCNLHDTRGILVELCCYYGISLSFVCRQPSGHEPSVQSLKQIFASHTAPKASTSSNSKPALIAEDDELDLDPEYAPKRALTTKVHLAQCSASAGKHRATFRVLVILGMRMVFHVLQCFHHPCIFLCLQHHCILVQALLLPFCWALSLSAGRRKALHEV